MKAFKFLYLFLLLLNTSQIYPQEQKILIFDPNGVSSSFQYTLSQLSEDSVFVVDSLENSIFNFNALFLFLDYPFNLTQEEGNRLIQFTSGNKPVYIYSDLFSQALDSVAFWNHIGVYERVDFLISVLVDSISGIDTSFTSGTLIDTSFMSGSLPVIAGEVEPILSAWWSGSFPTTYISAYDSLNVIVDLYNLIDDNSFLERVLAHFGLNTLQSSVQIQFFPPVDTALILGGCTTPEIVCRNLVSTSVTDSITIEPGFNTYFIYYDSSGYQIPIDNYYFIVTDSLNEFDYEIWYHPKSYTPFDPIQIFFDSTFYIDQNYFDIQLLVKLNGMPIDSFAQSFRADWGLGVEENGEVPLVFDLSQNYPNPFNPITMIRYSVPEKSNATLKIFNPLAEEIEIIIDETKEAGTYEAVWNAEGLPSGIYFYRLQAGDFVETKKMILLK